MSTHKVASLDEIPEEGAVRVMLEGKPLCIARSQGEVFALSDICSHADVSLS
ncbi:MAG: 3-phenylpropionate/trans-cinnamate dioxygenase ferredoxin component, partial [Actinomycetota bacterium]|nr:3-phenylpropionate/trans-cinnamate dioxygenase ferredoxin component [Actinomycetota bacterium]